MTCKRQLHADSHVTLNTHFVAVGLQYNYKNNKYVYFANLTKRVPLNVTHLSSLLLLNFLPEVHFWQTYTQFRKNDMYNSSK